MPVACARLRGDARPRAVQLTQRAARLRQVVQGEGPGARYAHVLALVGQRFLLVLGGNDGYKARSPRAAALRASVAC